MEYKCTCGATYTLSDEELQSPEFKCPNCGKIRGLTSVRSRHPKPWVAGLLAVLAPGLGHLYGGNLKFAISLLVSSIALSNILWYSIVYWNAPPFNILIPLLISATFLAFSIVTAVMTARRYHTLAGKPKRPTKFVYYAGMTIGWWVAASLLVPLFGTYGTYVTPTASMENTIMMGDRVLCDESAYDHSDPSRGDLVVFLAPSDKSIQYVKRCIASGGDSVQVVDKRVFVNGQEVPPSQTGAQSEADINSKRDNFGPYKVPAGSFFMLGDNRENSFDSRNFGAIEKRLIKGKLVRVWFNFRLGRIGIPLK